MTHRERVEIVRKTREWLLQTCRSLEASHCGDPLRWINSNISDEGLYTLIANNLEIRYNKEFDNDF